MSTLAPSPSAELQAASSSTLPSSAAKASSSPQPPGGTFRKTRRRSNKSQSTSVGHTGSREVSQLEEATNPKKAIETSPGPRSAIPSNHDGAQGGKQKGRKRPTDTATATTTAASSARAAVIKAKAKAQKSSKVKKAIDLANKQKGLVNKSSNHPIATGKQGKKELKKGLAAPSGKRPPGPGASKQSKGQRTRPIANDAVGQIQPAEVPSAAAAIQTVAQNATTSSSSDTLTASIGGAPSTSHASALIRESAQSTKTPGRRLRPGKAARQQAKLQAASQCGDTAIIQEQTTSAESSEPATLDVSVVTADDDSPTANVEHDVAAATSAPATANVGPTQVTGGTKRRRGSARPLIAIGKGSRDSGSTTPTENGLPATGPASLPLPSTRSKKAKPNPVKAVAGANANVAAENKLKFTLDSVPGPEFIASSETATTRTRHDLERELQHTVLQLKMAELQVQKLKLEAELAQSRIPT